MKLTQSAHAELSRLLAQSRELEYDGFAIYWADESSRENADPGQPIWEAKEKTGWKVKLVPISHLPKASVAEIDGIWFFFGSHRKDHLLDFKDQALWLDAEPLQLE